MIIEDDIRRILIDPILDGTLNLPLDDFILNSSEGQVSMGAHLSVGIGDDRFLLAVRASDSNDLMDLFSPKKKLVQSDAINAVATVNSVCNIKFPEILPPVRSSRRIVGEVRGATAELNPRKLELPLPPEDAESETDFESRIREHFPEFNYASRESNEQSRFEHIAIFGQANLKFHNGRVQRSSSHPFWGESDGGEERTWDGDALGGTFSLRQTGSNLEVGFRHESKSETDSNLAFDSLLQAVGVTHAINPWPIYLESRCEGRPLTRVFNLRRQIQGKIIPLSERDGHFYPTAPTDLIRCLAQFFYDLSEDDREKFRQSIWVFRGADSEVAPYPIRVAMISAVIEGLMTYMLSSRPFATEVFERIKNKAVAWADKLIEGASEEEIGDSSRLKGYLEAWPYAERRVQWDEAFNPLFPGKEKWVAEMFKVFRRYRNGPAHGNFSKLLKSDPIGDLDALGRLAGFVNLVFAALASYKGSLAKAAFSNERMTLG